MALRLKDVCCYYGEGELWETAAVNDISFEVERGELVGLVGHTGSGKSTLAQLISGLLIADRGEIQLEDLCLTEQNRKKRPKAVELAKRVGMVFQYPEHQLFAETVSEEIGYGPKNLGWAKEKIAAEVREMAVKMGIDDELLAASPYQLSGGEKRKVALASVLIMRPPFLVLDEPFVGLDVTSRREFLKLLLEWQRENNSAIICISHDIDQLAMFCKRLLVLQGGHLRLDKPIRQAFNEAELLRECGVCLPLARQAVLACREQGMDVDTSALTLEEAAAAIKAALRTQDFGKAGDSRGK